MISGGHFMEKRFICFFPEIKKTPLFFPCLGFLELSWPQMPDGYSLNHDANL